MLEALSKKQKIIFIIILSIMVSVIIYYIYSTLYKEDFSFSDSENILSDGELIENIDNNTDYSEHPNTNSITVYICGAVKNSKVVTLNENSRICDAIDAVGGLNNDADLTNINLAYILEDGEKIYIPKKGEEIEKENSSISNLSSISESNSSKSNKININKATQTELESIPGIGPSTALKILDYREKNGKFSSIEDIKNVSGIGDKKFEKIKDYISIK